MRGYPSYLTWRIEESQIFTAFLRWPLPSWSHPISPIDGFDMSPRDSEVLGESIWFHTSRSSVSFRGKEAIHLRCMAMSFLGIHLEIVGLMICKFTLASNIGATNLVAIILQSNQYKDARRKILNIDTIRDTQNIAVAEMISEASVFR